MCHRNVLTGKTIHYLKYKKSTSGSSTFLLKKKKKKSVYYQCYEFQRVILVKTMILFYMID